MDGLLYRAGQDRLTLAADDLHPEAGTAFPFHHVKPDESGEDGLIQLDVPDGRGVRVPPEHLPAPGSFHKVPLEGVQAVREAEGRHPFPRRVRAVLPALGEDPRHVGQDAQVHEDPLAGHSVLGAPGLAVVEPGVPRLAPARILGRARPVGAGRELPILDGSRAES